MNILCFLNVLFPFNINLGYFQTIFEVSPSQISFKAWNDFYHSSESQISLPSITNSTFNGMTTSKLIPDSNSVWISNCNFQDFDNYDGGALSYWIQSGHLLVEYSTFSMCHSESYGGAIFVDYADCVLNCVSSMSCSAYMGSFIFVGYSRSTLINIDSFNETSMSNCTVSQSYTSVQGSGNIKNRFLNITYNSAKSCSGFSCSPKQPDSNGSYQANIGYSSCLNNTAEKFCIALEATPGTYEIQCSNIISNNGESIILVCGVAKIISCCLFDKKPPA